MNRERELKLLEIIETLTGIVTRVSENVDELVKVASNLHDRVVQLEKERADGQGST